jgi:hypothetical protein
MMRAMRVRGWVILAVVVMSWTTSGTGGERSGVRAMGMARTHTAAASGLDAVAVNPAALAFPDRGTVTLSLLPAALHVGSDLLDYGIYTEYFTGEGADDRRSPRHLTEADKQKILDAFQETKPVTRLDVELMVFGATVKVEGVGRFAVTTTEAVSGMAEIARGYAEFLMNGNTPGSDYRLDGTRAGAVWTREYAMSFGGALPPPPFLRTLAAGATVKLVHGYGYYDIERFDTRLVTSDAGILSGSIDFLAHAAGAMPFDGGYRPFPRPAGTGIGFDLGIAGDLSATARLGLSVTDIGRMTWRHDIVELSADTALVIDDPLLADQRDAVENVLKGERRDGEEFSTPLPTTVHAGVQVDAGALLGGGSGAWIVGADIARGFVHGVRSIRTVRGSIGTEYRLLGWLPVRSGISFGGSDGVNVALGLGVELGAFDCQVATENVGWLFSPSSFSYGSLAVGTRLRF